MSRSDDDVLVRVEGVSKKFCRSLKKSLWYGVCDIAGELLPFGKRQRVAGSELLVASGNASAGGGDRAAGASEPVTSYPPLATPAADLNSWDDDLREGEFYAVKNVSFELRRGQCLGLIGHNGAGTQAAGQPRGRLLRAARRVNRDLGKVEKDCRKAAPKEEQVAKTCESNERERTNQHHAVEGAQWVDRGSITMRGRVGALIALGAGFNPILTGREPEGWEARRTSNQRLALRVQRRREGANQNFASMAPCSGSRKINRSVGRRGVPKKNAWAK